MKKVMNFGKRITSAIVYHGHKEEKGRVSFLERSWKRKKKDECENGKEPMNNTS